MEQVATSTPQWTVSARSDGDVLAVRVGGLGLDLGFLGAPTGFTPPEVETWLTELIGMAGTTGSEAPAMRDPASSIPIPRVLHQALTGLLFYEAELWGGAGEQPPCTVACAAGGGTVAFGWAGSGRVEISLDGRSFEPVWLLVRDQDGRDARAFVADARSSLEARVSWPADPAGTLPPKGEIVAQWPGLPEAALDADREAQAVREAAGEVLSPLYPPVAPARSDGDEPGPGPGRPRGFWQFRGWMDRLAGPRARRDTPRDPVPEPEPIAHDVPGVPDLIPEPEPAVAEAPVVEAQVPEPAAEARFTSESVQTVDPFDLGPLAEFEPTLVPDPAAMEPEVEIASAQAPEPAAAEPVAETAPEPVAETVPEPAAEMAPEPALDVALARALELVAESDVEIETATVREPSPGVRPESGAAGVLEARPLRARPRPAARRPAWPEPEELARVDGRPFWQQPWFVAAVVLTLFAAGWFLGRVEFSSGGKSIGAALKAMGFGPARYELTTTSRPSGAWIAVDGVDQALRTPATLQLKPGVHQVVFSFSGVGGSSHTVTGKRGERVMLDAELWGSLKVTVPGGSEPVSVVVDGMPRGYAPLEVDRLQPGIHRLQFSGPGVAPWEQTVEVHVNHTAELVAQPIASPATGVLEVRATLADETGSEPLSGAQVWIDGQPRGVTPLKLELPRGPHSIRVRHRDVDGPVQVIELPGGNARYATIELGLDPDAPRLAASLPALIPLGRSTVLSASLDRAREGDVREMWLHVRTPEGAWRRYPMTVMKAPGGLVGVVVFPTVLFDARGRAAWYVSAQTPMGDEYFTEMQPAQAAKN